MTNFEQEIIERLGRIASALETLANCVQLAGSGADALRMVDVYRAKVYSTHLGSKLKDGG